MNLRNNSLLVLFTIAFVIVLVLVVVIFDQQYYQARKRELIEEKAFPDWALQDREFNDLLETYLKDEATEEQEKKLDKALDDFVTGDIPIASVEISKEGVTLISKKRKNLGEFNTLKNSLILPSFKGRIKRKLQHPDRSDRFTGTLLFTYTTPKDFAPVEELTRRYWVYLAIIVAALLTVYFLMIRFIILPIKKVTEAIQNSRDRVARFIDNPHSRLERLYNTMARDALLTAISIGLRNPKSRQLRMTLSELFEFLSPRITEWFDFGNVWLLDLIWEGPSRLAPVRQFPAEDDGQPTAWEALGESFDPSLVRNLQTSWEAKTLQLFHRPLAKREGHLFAGVLPSTESDGHMRILAIVTKRNLDGNPLAWCESTADKIYRQVLGLVERQIGQSRELFREKSEANISLSRNLGHDLTNIIATNKLELMTVSHILRGDPSTWFDTPEKAEIIKDSLTRLLDNTRSQQQIVNLYRAYEYLKSPRYEMTDLNKVIDEVIGIFRLSMSAAVETSFVAGEIPEAEVEPRLLKLALFNLMTNAQDAIRRLPVEEQGSAKIVVQTLWDRAKDRIAVRISDTGPGIRTRDGRLARPEELERIFDIGYTTKVGGEGEGLGLNWVRTILTEFHAGELHAYNRSEGGATFEFFLALRQNFPDQAQPEQKEKVVF